MRKRTVKQTPIDTGVTQHEQPKGVAEEPQTSQSVSTSTHQPLADYLAVMLAHTSDAIIALDEHFQVRDLNPAAIKALGASAEDMTGRSCIDVLRCKNLNRMQLCGTSSCPLIRVLQQKKSLPSEEFVFGTVQDHFYEASTSVTPVAVAESLYVIFNARDLSSLKVANRVRSNFVSMVSHELRTPLNSVHGFIDLLLHGHMGNLTDEQCTYLGYTQEGVQQLISIVEDILFMTRSDLGQFEIKQAEVQVRGLVRLINTSLHPQALKASVELRHDIPADLPPIYADPLRIKQVLNNLVTNAIKFTPPGGTVTIAARLHDEQFVGISVIDTGYGIPPEDRHHVFERFYQSNHSEQSMMGGYGLGLSIAQLIVEQHGGTINFETVQDEGTTFYFTVPIYKKTAIETEEERSS
ncbi:MAG: PAS domain S-box protein [Chloroflexi bacterium]|nr:MAG: PAS domain S-box protein [Chloroflexota bacterium]